MFSEKQISLQRYPHSNIIPSLELELFRLEGNVYHV